MSAKSLLIIGVICWVFVGAVIAWVFLDPTPQGASLGFIGLLVIAFLLGLITLPLGLVNLIKEKKTKRNQQSGML